MRSPSPSVTSDDAGPSEFSDEDDVRKYTRETSSVEFLKMLDMLAFFHSKHEFRRKQYAGDLAQTPFCWFFLCKN